VSFIDNIVSTINGELPEFESLDEGIDFTMEHLAKYSKGLDEVYFLDKRWLEIRDDVNFQENILHVFQDDGSYLRILDGDITEGKWLESVGGIIISYAERKELYECVFLNDDFLILKKHGDAALRGQRKYFYMVREGFGRGYEWNELLEIMFRVYRSNMLYFIMLAFVVLAIVLLFIFSIV
jgi:hypothetical protein